MRSMKTFFLPVVIVSVFAYVAAIRADPVAAAIGPGVCDSTGIDVEANGTTTIYATLAEAFAAINSGTHTGAVRIEICGNTFENGPAVLNASGSGSASYTSVNISPVGGAARAIESDVGGGAAIDLNGADNITIDGINAAGNSLTIANLSASSTTGTSTILFKNDASNNVITNTNVLGSGTVSIGTNGGVIFFSLSSGSSGTGNNNNTISFCNIGPASTGSPSKAVYANGSQLAGNRNAGNVITGNNIFDYFAMAGSAGIYINSGNTAWTISNNRLFQTVPWILNGLHEGIRISTLAGVQGENFQITGNTIGYSTASGTGSYTLTGNAPFRGIHISNSNPAGLPSSVQGNKITAINYSSNGSGAVTSSPFIALLVGQSAGPVNIGTIAGNEIGSLDGTSAITVTSSTGSNAETHGILNVSNHPSLTHNISNNRIGSVSVTNTITGAMSFWGIRLQVNSSTAATIANNTIASVSNSASNTSSRVVGLGLDNTSLTPVTAITGNAVRDLSMSAANTGTGNMTSVIGIHFAASSASGHTIAQNTISGLSNTHPTAATTIIGINYSGPNAGSNTVERNKIFGLSAASSDPSAAINGINVVAGTTTFRNNSIALGNEIHNGSAVSGINETAAGTDNFYHNSIYIGGAVAGTGNSFAFQSSITTNTRNIQNNIFVNTRTTSGGGKNYSIRVGGTTPNPAGLTSTNNVLFVPAGNFVGLFNSIDRASLSDWQAATGEDLNSISEDPQLAAPAASVPDLHIRTSSPAVSLGAAIAVAADYDADPRSASAPDIGADEVVRATGGIVPVGAFYNLSLVHGDTLSGNVSVAGTLNIAGVTNTGVNKLTLGCGGAVSGPQAGGSNPNYIVGNVEKLFCGPGTFTFPVGTLPAADASGYSPVTAAVTGGTFPSALTASVTDEFLPGLTPAMSVSRFWKVVEAGNVTADLAFNYRQEDVNGVENMYKVFRRSGGVTTEHTPNSVDAVNNIASVSGISSFSDWGIGIGVVSAANASLGGRISTASGRGVPFAKVTVAGGNLPEPKTVIANAFGYYRFGQLPAGQTYVVTVNAKRFTFASPSRIVSLDDDVSDADFVADHVFLRE